MKQKIQNKEVFVNPAKGSVAIKGDEIVMMPFLGGFPAVASGVGVSVCNFDKGDVFDEKLGTKLAFVRTRISIRQEQRKELGKVKTAVRKFQRQVDAEIEALKAQADKIILDYEKAATTSADTL